MQLVRLRLEAGRVWDGSSVILWALRVLILCFAVWRTQLHRGVCLTVSVVPPCVFASSCVCIDARVFDVYARLCV